MSAVAVLVYLIIAVVSVEIIGATATAHARSRPPARRARRGRGGPSAGFDPGDPKYPTGTAGHPDGWLSGPADPAPAWSPTLLGELWAEPS